MLDNDHEEELQKGATGDTAIGKGLLQALLFIQPSVRGPIPTGDDTRGGNSYEE